MNVKKLIFSWKTHMLLRFYVFNPFSNKIIFWVVITLMRQTFSTNLNFSAYTYVLRRAKKNGNENRFESTDETINPHSIQYITSNWLISLMMLFSFCFFLLILLFCFRYMTLIDNNSNNGVSLPCTRFWLPFCKNRRKKIIIYLYEIWSVKNVFIPYYWKEP